MRKYAIWECLKIRKKYCMGIFGIRKKWMSTIAAALFFAVFYWQCDRAQIKNVFRHLKAEQVESISVYAPNAKFEARLSRPEIEWIVRKLNKVELNGEPTRDYLEYMGCGGGPDFHIRLRYGGGFDFTVSSPFYIIDFDKYEHHKVPDRKYEYGHDADEVDVGRRVACWIGDTPEDYVIRNHLSRASGVLTDKYFPKYSRPRYYATQSEWINYRNSSYENMQDWKLQQYSPGNLRP